MNIIVIIIIDKKVRVRGIKGWLLFTWLCFSVPPNSMRLNHHPLFTLNHFRYCIFLSWREKGISPSPYLNRNIPAWQLLAVILNILINIYNLSLDHDTQYHLLLPFLPNFFLLFRAMRTMTMLSNHPVLSNKFYDADIINSVSLICSNILIKLLLIIILLFLQ